MLETKRRIVPEISSRGFHQRPCEVTMGIAAVSLIRYRDEQKMRPGRGGVKTGTDVPREGRWRISCRLSGLHRFQIRYGSTLHDVPVQQVVRDELFETERDDGRGKAGVRDANREAHAAELAAAIRVEDIKRSVQPLVERDRRLAEMPVRGASTRAARDDGGAAVHVLPRAGQGAGQRGFRIQLTTEPGPCGEHTRNVEDGSTMVGYHPHARDGIAVMAVTTIAEKLGSLAVRWRP